GRARVVHWTWEYRPAPLGREGAGGGVAATHAVWRDEARIHPPKGGEQGPWPSPAKSAKMRFRHPEGQMDGKREMLRHVVATVAYRGGKVLRGAPEGFGEFRAAPGSRSALEILGHLGDLFDWAAELAAGEGAW